MTKVKITPNLAVHSSVERRRHERLPLRLPIRFIYEGPTSNSCFTENISTGGFYCVALNPFEAGDRLTAELSLPAHSPNRDEKRILLRCDVQVIRVDSTWLGAGFGVGFQIEKCTLHLERNDRPVSPQAS